MTVDAELDATAASLRTAVTRLARRLRAEAGQEEYTTSEVNVIRRLLEAGPETISALSRAEGMRPQSMSAIVAALVVKGIVERRPDPADGRATRVHLTPEAEEQLAQGRAAKQTWLTQVMAERLSVSEQELLRNAAALVERLIENNPGETS